MSKSLGLKMLDKKMHYKFELFEVEKGVFLLKNLKHYRALRNKLNRWLLDARNVVTENVYSRMQDTVTDTNKAYKCLEIRVEDHIDSNDFEILEIDLYQDFFYLKDIKSMIGLFNCQEVFLLKHAENYTEKHYWQALQNRSNCFLTNIENLSMSSINENLSLSNYDWIHESGSLQTSDSHMETPNECFWFEGGSVRSEKSIIVDDAQNLLIANVEGGVIDWSIQDEEVYGKYEKVMENEIYSIAATSDNNTLFVSDLMGYQKQIYLPTKQIVKDYGKLHGCIASIAVTKNDKFLFTSDYHNGSLKQLSIEQKKVIRNYGQVLQLDEGISSMVVTNNNTMLLIGGTLGSLSMLDLTRCNNFQDYSDSVYGQIYYMTATPDSNNVIFYDESDYIKLVALKSKLLQRTFGPMNGNFHISIAVSDNNKYMFVAYNHFLKVFDQYRQDLVKELVEVDFAKIKEMAMSKDGKTLYTLSNDKNNLCAYQKEWCVEKMKLVKDHKEIYNVGSVNVMIV